MAGDIFSGIGSAVGDFFAASGHKKAAKAYDQAAVYARQGAQLEGVSTEIAQMQVERNVYRTIGAQNAALAGAGFESSFDLLSDSQRQGAIDFATAGIQGAVNILGQEASAAAYAGQAASERAQAKGGLFGGILKIAKIGAGFL